MVDANTTHVVCRYRMCIFHTLFAYLFWLAYNIRKFVLATVTKLVGSGGYKYHPCGPLWPNAHINYLICISVLIG